MAFRKALPHSVRTLRHGSENEVMEQKPRMKTATGMSCLTAPVARASLKMAAAAVCVLVSVAPSVPAGARGGFHGMGGFGMHGDGRMGRGELVTMPAYVLITVSSITDADAFKKALQDLTASTAPFSGRLAVDAEKSAAWEGISSEQIVMLQFASAGQGQSWKDSDAFKSFDTELKRSSTSTMQFVQGLPMPAGGGRGRGGRFDAKAFEPNVKDYDRLLNRQLKNICKGC